MSFNTVKSHEQKLSIALRKVAKIVGGIITPHISGSKIINEAQMLKALEAYSNALIPYAQTLVAQILHSVNKNNERAWRATSNQISLQLNSALSQSIIGQTAKQLQNRQVELIKTIPIEAGQRAQELARSAMIDSTRANVVADELQKTTQVTESNATRIARTEIAKANATLNQARAQAVGVSHYHWRTMGDGDVRPSHAVMNGIVCSYAEPPEIEGEGAHGPGEFPNCRCFADPIIDLKD